MDQIIEESEKLECCSYYKSFYEVSLDMTMEERIMFEDAIFRYFFYDEPITTTGNRFVDGILKAMNVVILNNKKRGVNSRKGANARKSKKAVETEMKPKCNSVTTETKPNGNQTETENNFGLNRTETVTQSGLNQTETEPKPNKNNNKNNNNNKKEIINNKNSRSADFSSSSSQEIVVEAINDVNKYPEMLRGSEYRDVRGNYEDVIWLEDVQDKSDDYWNSFDVHVKIDGFWSIERFIQFLSRHHSCSMFSIPASFPDGLRNRIKAEVNKYCPSMGYIED